MTTQKKNTTKVKKVELKEKMVKVPNHKVKYFMSHLTLEQITLLGIALIVILLIIIALISNIRPKIKNGEELVAKVGGSAITADDFYQKLSSKYGRDFLIETVDTMLLNKLYKTTSDMEKAADANIAQYKTTYGKQFEDFLKYNGINGGEEEFKILLIKNTKVTNVIDKYIKSVITKDEMKSYYEESIYGDIKASHILIKFTTDENSTDDAVKADQARALSKAKEIILELKAGATFADLAKKYSEDTSNASNGGDLGYFNTGTMEETFEKAALKLSVKAYTKEPVKTSYGYHIILKTGQKEKPTYAKSKETIIEKLVSQYKTTDSTITNKALIDMRKKNKLKIYDPLLKKAYDKYMNELLNSSTTSTTSIPQQ